MSSTILHDPTFPHGAPDGYQQGCHGSQCPAPVACRDVQTRYRGDYGFRRRIDAGETAESIVADETARAEQTKRAEVAAARAARLAVRKSRVKPNQPPKQRTWFPYDTLRTLHAEGLTDTEIMARMGKSRQSVGDARRNLGLPANTKRSSRITEQYPALHAEGLTDQQIADRLGAHPQYIHRVRRDLGLKPNPVPRPTKAPAILALSATGATPDEIAAQLGLTAKYVERTVNLASKTPEAPAQSGASSIQEAA